MACGYDRGVHSGDVETSSNSIYHLIHTIPSIMVAYLSNKQVGDMLGLCRGSLPRGKMIQELDIESTLANFANNTSGENDVFHALLESRIIKDYELEECLK